MRPATFTLVTAPAVLGGIYLSYRTGVYVTRDAGFPWQVVLGAIAAAAAAAFGLRAATRRSPPRPLTAGGVALELAAVAASLLLPAFLDAFEMPLTFGLFALFGLRLLRGTEGDRNAAAVAVALDFAIEALLVYRGSFAYRHALVAPLPLWLPAVWANLGVAARRLYPLLPELRRPRPTGDDSPQLSA
ncbi:MAG: hypothetical protein ACOX6T_11020 [Myxococcales bacterium]|jgi:hypothetical protein